MPLYLFSYINNECKKFNCKPWIMPDQDGCPQIAFYAVKNIKKESELSFKYSDNYFTGDLVCKCSTCAPMT